MANFFDTVIEVLKADERFFSEDGVLLRNAVYEAAMQMDAALIKFLYANEATRARFFTDVDGIAVFDKVGFGWVINNRDFLPDSYTRYKNKIGLVDDRGEFISASSDVELVFPYKDCILEFDSTRDTENRPETFFNEHLSFDEIDRLTSPKIFHSAFRHTASGVVEPAITVSSNDNLIIKGNNFLALCSLLPRYEGKIKCMYWDILYNTDSDRVPYNDSFKHSSWLLMMKNRLEIAKKLLSADSVIIIECDKNEDAYLKVLCDEIFGRDNFVNSITVQSSTPSGTKLAHRDKTILKTKDTLLIYKKGRLTIHPQYIPSDNLTNFNYWLEFGKDDEPVVRNLRDVMIEKGVIDKKQKIDDIKMSASPVFEAFVIQNADKIFRKQPSLPDNIKKESKNNPHKVLSYDDDGILRYCQNGYRFAFLDSSIRTIEGQPKVTQLLCDIWTDISFHGTQYEGNVDLPAGKKPERLVKRIIDMFMNPGDIILDAYLGSGTTASVAQKMGVQYIGIEQLDAHYQKAISRLEYVISGHDSGPVSAEIGYSGGGSFITFELAKLNQEYVEAIQSATNEDQLNKIYNEVLNSGFISYKVKPTEITVDADFSALSFEQKQQLLMEMLDKNQLYINYCDIDDEDYGISEADKAFTRSFYGEV